MTTNYYATGLNDALTNSCWHLFRMNAFHAWKYTTGNPAVKYCIMGSGFDPHVDIPLAADVDCINILKGTHLASDLKEYNPVEPSTTPGVGYSHDTVCYGLVSASLNTIGIAGIAPSATPVLMATGSTTTINTVFVNSALSWALGRGVTIFILPIALNPGGMPTTGDAEFRMQFWNNNALLFLPTGDDYVYSPGTLSLRVANLPGGNAILVGGIDVNDAVGNNFQYPEGAFASPPGGATYGAADITAPCKNILTASPQIDMTTLDYLGNNTFDELSDSSYRLQNGTSLSDPLAAGVAVLIQSINTSLTNAQTKNILLAATDLSYDSNYRSLYPTANISNAGKAVDMARATLSANNNVPIPYINFYGPGCVETITSGVMTATLNGSLMVDIAGWCNLNPDTLANDVKSIQVYVGTQKIYDGLAANMKAVATTGTNLVRIIVTSSSGITDVTYSDILVGSLVLAQPLNSTTNYHATGIHNTRISDQWSLFRINAFHAWKYTTGDPAIKIGFADLGYDTNMDLPVIPDTNCYNIAADVGMIGAYPELENSPYNVSDFFYNLGSDFNSSHDTGMLTCCFAKMGNNNICGVAPNCTPILIGCEYIADTTTVTPGIAADQYIDGINWNFANIVKEFKKAYELGARVITCSGAGPAIYGYQHPDGSVTPLPDSVVNEYNATFATLWNGGGVGAISLCAGNDWLQTMQQLQRPSLALLNPLVAFAPQLYPETITVGAIGADDTLGYWNGNNKLLPTGNIPFAPTTLGSVYGTLINLVAPGSDILQNGNAYGYTDANGLHYGSGCSPASPIAAGVAGLILSINPSLTNQQLTNILTNYGADASVNATYATYFPNARIVSAGKGVAVARATLAVNVNTPIPYVNFLSPLSTYTTAPGGANGSHSLGYDLQGVHTSTNITTGLTTKILNGPVVIDINGFCNFDPITGSNDITTVELWVGSTQVYSGVPAVLSGTATSGSNQVKVIAHSTYGSTSETYADIAVGTLGITEYNAVCTVSSVSVITAAHNIVTSTVSSFNAFIAGVNATTQTNPVVATGIMVQTTGKIRDGNGNLIRTWLWNGTNLYEVQYNTL